MKISIFGLGYVGCVSLGCLAKNGHELIGVDVNATKVDQINNGRATIIEKDIDFIIKEQFIAGRISATMDFKKAISDSEISIIAVGTPTTNKGHLNLEYIFKVAENIGVALSEKNEFHIIAIRSTVLPGTSDKFASIIEKFSGKLHGKDFALVSNPEFLREGTAVYDYFHPPITLLGSHYPEAAEKLAELYRQLPSELIITEVKVAEIMKYVSNTFHALKVSFGNEIGNICQALDIDSHHVMEIFCKDKELNISSYYFKPGFAYGGSCLPKDLKGLQTLAHDLYLKVPVIDSIDKTNEIQIDRALEIILSYQKRKIGFLGLSFKAGTDDLRNSPAVTVIETLLGKGYEISIYDYNVQLSKLTGTNKEYIDSHIPHLSKLMVNDIEEMLHNVELVVINNNEKVYDQFVNMMEINIPVLDLVRMGIGVRNRPLYKGINW